jgi:hypothetical protein
MIKLPAFVCAHRTKIVCVTTATSLFVASIAASAQTKAPGGAGQPQAATAEQARAAREREEWRKAIMAMPRPKNGCYTATYPEKAWRAAICKPSTPHKLYLPRRGWTSRIDVVGGAGPDFAAVVTGHISEAEGSFDQVTGVTSNSVYSLQLNTDRFSTSTCSGSPNAGCRGWEQFVYESSGGGFIQYWLLEYGPTGTLCPLPRHTNCQAGYAYSDGWCAVNYPLYTGDPNPIQCVVNAANEAAAPAEPMTSLGQLMLTGAAAGVGSATSDSITVTVGGTPHMATGGNYFPDLDNQWQEVEFNVFGDGNSSQATFNTGSFVQVRTAVTSGTTTGPGCQLVSFTGESNNLTLNNTLPSASPGTMPALVFSQINPSPSGPLATCVDALSLGDTHLTTFGGLLYDFQATGDFLLAETGPDFRVQTRQVSGAPTWPDAAVNKAVAVQAGKNRVAICLPGRVVVDGKTATIRDGGRLGLTSGGNVLRKGNDYYVLAPSGDSVRATLNSTHIDVSVGLGRWPGNVRGLLANANGQVNEIAARDGAVLKTPFAFESLYGHYTTSWRVPRSESILSSCGEGVKAGTPGKPFFANDLNSELARRNRDLCVKAGVKEGPMLDACMIDVAMLGQGAAKAFVRMRPPVAVGDARKK